MKKGFTLLELLVTISIIGILLAVGSVSFTTAQKRGRDSRREADMKGIGQALEQCYAVDSEYPAVSFGSSLDCGGGQTTMELVPEDPLPSQSYTYTPDGATILSYCLCAELETVDSGNAYSDGSAGGGDCSFSGSGTKDYFCVSNQQ